MWTHFVTGFHADVLFLEKNVPASNLSGSPREYDSTRSLQYTPGLLQVQQSFDTIKPHVSHARHTDLSRVDTGLLHPISCGPRGGNLDLEREFPFSFHGPSVTSYHIPAGQ